MAELTTSFLFSTKHHHSSVVLGCALARRETQLCWAAASDSDLLAAFDGEVQKMNLKQNMSGSVHAGSMYVRTYVAMYKSHCMIADRVGQWIEVQLNAFCSLKDAVPLINIVCLHHSCNPASFWGHKGHLIATVVGRTP